MYYIYTNQTLKCSFRSALPHEIDGSPLSVFVYMLRGPKADLRSDRAGAITDSEEAKYALPVRSMLLYVAKYNIEHAILLSPPLFLL